MIKAILFDKDGTLLDFNGTWLQPYLDATRFLSESVGKPELADELMSRGGYIAKTESWTRDSPLASGSNRQILELWGEILGLPVKGNLETTVSELFAEIRTRYVPATVNMGRLLEKLHADGFILGMATMDDESNARGMLAELDLEGLFDFVCGADSGYGVKPEAGMVRAFCQRCEIEETSVMMVGDSPKDLVMGRNAGVRFCTGVLSGAHGLDDLEPLADKVLDDISALPDLLATLG